MTVIISKEHGTVYKTLTGFGTPEERIRADQLDQLVEHTINDLVGKLDAENLLPKAAGQGNVSCYWKLGKALRSITDHTDLITTVELPLLWRNVKLYLPPTLLYKDRGVNREHLWYCYRLASYSYELVLKMKWSQWVTLFDSDGINQEARFDTWFGKKLTARTNELSRGEIRSFVPLVNTLLKNIELSQFNNNEVTACYEACWQLMNKMGSVPMDKVKKTVSSDVKMFDSLINLTITPEQYADEILKK